MEDVFRSQSDTGSHPLAAAGPLRRITCVNPAGSITARATARGEAQATWKRLPDPAIPRWHEWGIRFERGPGMVTIEVVPPDDAGFGPSAGRAPEFAIVLELPGAPELERIALDLAAGAIAVEDLAAEQLRVVGAAATIDVRGFRGGAALKSAAGGIRIADCHGTIRAATDAGSINAAAGSGTLELAAAAGRIGIEARRGASGSVRATASAGGIDIALGADADATLRLRTAAGSPRVDGLLAAAGRNAWVLGSGEGFSIEAQARAGRIVARVIPPGG
ncbi:MAG: DUF4097 family beta strand repeat-containing protein [Chloroflexota bacterium]